MTNEEEFIDFALVYMKNEYPKGVKLRTIYDEYIKQKQGDTSYDPKSNVFIFNIQSEYMDKYWERKGQNNSLLTELTIKQYYLDIIKNNGSLSNYKRQEAVSLSEEHSSKVNKENLEIKALKTAIKNNEASLKNYHFTKVYALVMTIIAIFSILVDIFE